MLQFDPLIPGKHQPVPFNRFEPRRERDRFSPALRARCVIFAFMMSLIVVTGAQANSENEYTLPTQQPYIIDNHVYRPLSSASGFRQTGIASWYGPDFNGHLTSDGEVYNMYGQTAAHKILPMNTILLVSNLENGKSTIVRINDRGPFVKGRILDLSYTAAKKIDLVRNGTARVRVTAIGKAETGKPTASNSPLDIDFNLGQFYVQVGAFRNKDNALQLQKRFLEYGHATIIQRFFSQKSVLYRVCVYAGRELHGAHKVKRVLHQHGWNGIFIVAN